MPVDYTDEERAKAEAFFANVPDAPSDAAPSHDDPDPDQEDTDSEETPTSQAATPAAKDDQEGEPPAKEESKPRGPGKKVEAILEALRNGDEDTLGDLLDEDPSAWAETTQNAIKRRRALSRVKQERDHALEKAKEIVDRWKPVSDLAIAIDQGQDYTQVPALVEMLLGRSWKDIERNFVRSQRGLPAEAPAAPESKELVELVQADVPSDHEARKLPGWQEGVASLLREHYDPDLGESTISVAQATARWLRKEKAAHNKRLEVWSSKGRSTQGRRTPTLERASSGGPAPARKMTREEFFAQFGK